MKTLMVSSLVLAFMTGAALAQTAAPDPAGMPPPASPAPAGNAAPPPPPAVAADAAGVGTMAPPAPPVPPPPGGPRLPGPQIGGPDAPRGQRPPPPPPRGAHVHLQRGDLVLDVKCAEDDPTKACADAVMQVLDHLPAATANTAKP